MAKTVITTSIFVTLFNSCNINTKDLNTNKDLAQDSLIQIKDLSENELLLTSNVDYNSLILLVPLEVSINKKE